jgi:tRNA G18 (ribose-2'-O)-methylase SpoU
MRKLRTIEMNRLTVEEFKAAEKLPLIVVLDDVRSLYNVGSVFRTCDAFRVERVCLCGITACPPNAEIHKTALGGEDAVDWQYFASADEAVSALHEEGMFVFSIEQVEGSTKLQHLSLDPSRRYAVVFGNEVKGVRQSVVDASDGCLEIPQFGTKHSLNVANTASIVIWEFARHLVLNGCPVTTDPFCFYKKTPETFH